MSHESNAGKAQDHQNPSRRFWDAADPFESGDFELFELLKSITTGVGKKQRSNLRAAHRDVALKSASSVGNGGNSTVRGFDREVRCIQRREYEVIKGPTRRNAYQQGLIRELGAPSTILLVDRRDTTFVIDSYIRKKTNLRSTGKPGL